MSTQQINRRLRLRDLDTLIAVIESRGLRRAAERLHLSQPAVSKAMQELEELLGYKLLERGRRGVEPTEFGLALLNRSKVIFDELQGAAADLAHLADPASGVVRLGAVETFMAGLVSATIDYTLGQYPRMSLILESGQSQDLINYFLRERLVEFVVARPWSLPLPDEVVGEPMFRDHLQIVVGMDHPMARRRRITIAELHQQSWVLSRNEMMPESPVADAFAQVGLTMPPGHVTSGSLGNRFHLLRTGRFVTVFPHSLFPFAPQLSEFRRLPIQLPLWRTPTMILTLKGRTLSPSARLFLTNLRKLAEPLMT